MISDKVKIALIKVAPTLSHIELIELVFEECQQAQRQWVGLTQTEVVDLLCEYNKLTGNVGWQQLIYMTEAKLKEKNT